MKTNSRVFVLVLFSITLFFHSLPSHAKGNVFAEKQISSVTELTKQVPNELKVEYQTKLVEWGGDGKWHKMSEIESGVFWVNYLDLFKFKLSGNYSGLTVKVTTSMGTIIYEKTGLNVVANGSIEISNPNFIGENETSFFLEISDGSKIVYKCRIESVPGGE
jgi:hypothetical protein